MTEEYDLQTFFGAVARRSVARRDEQWAIKTDIFLGLFSFQKFVMYKDLEGEHACVHFARLIRRAHHARRGRFRHRHARRNSRDEARRAISRPRAQRRSSTPTRASSGRLRPLSKGHDVVIEGPPGTGKSQTITNLIAQALSADKSVLFVAEKMAALQVVHSRLVQAGLGEFCLELHSTKAQKRKVMQGLAAALDASLQPVVAPTASTQRLPQVRHSLNEYVAAVHPPDGALGISPYRAYGELGAVLGAPRAQWSGDPLTSHANSSTRQSEGCRISPRTR